MEKREDKCPRYSQVPWEASTFATTTHHVCTYGDGWEKLRVMEVLLNNQSYSVMVLKLPRKIQTADRQVRVNGAGGAQTKFLMYMKLQWT